MRYYIDDEITIDLDVSTKTQPVVETELVCEDKFIKEEVIDVPVVLLNNDETPEVSQLQVIDYGSSSIEVSFNVSTDRAEEVVKGILCGTTNPPTFENADFRLLYGQGNMDLVFAGLHSNTEYYLRPYALSNLGYKYGDVVAQRTKASPIPDEYQLVEYIAISNLSNAYINSDIMTQRGLRIVIGFKPLNIIPMDSIFGNRSGGEGNSFGITYGTYPRAYFGDGYNGYSPFANANNKYDLDYNNIDGKLYINGSLNTTTLNAESYNFLNPVPIWVGQMGAWQGNTGAKEIYYCHISVYDNWMVKLYPVYRKADNKPGMYDIVNNVFYTNAGTGEFTVGPDKEWEE